MFLDRTARRLLRDSTLLQNPEPEEYKTPNAIGCGRQWNLRRRLGMRTKGLARRGSLSTTNRSQGAINKLASMLTGISGAARASDLEGTPSSKYTAVSASSLTLRIRPPKGLVPFMMSWSFGKGKYLTYNPSGWTISRPSFLGGKESSLVEMEALGTGGEIAAHEAYCRR
ncbi:hypothetical protein BDN71DRAFT_1431120 [Pleurotus eryngii]|uniref:Uncharacterized protein n=1 Tax=Pleurotus eryngii TaxID=5323 RepID=A0A9P5ZWC2_PLEER|nr:hypothetical protein BDN71DRAFT_1431120 [Pleurotus eryngii]